MRLEDGPLSEAALLPQVRAAHRRLLRPPPRGTVDLTARGLPGMQVDDGPSIDDVLMDERP